MRRRWSLGVRVAGCGALALAASARAQDVPDTDDARDGVALAHGVRSVRVMRAGEVIRSGPGDAFARRGTAARSARLPALEAALGPGCATRWVRVARAAWICQDNAEPSNDAPDGRALPTVPSGEILPYQYAFASYAGVPVYRRLDDVASDERAQELERGMGIALDGATQFEGRTFARTAGGRWVASRDLAWARPSNRQGTAYDPGETVDSVAFTARRLDAWPSADAARVHRGAPLALVDDRTAVHLRERAQSHGHAFVRTDAGWVAAASVRAPDASVPPPADLAVDERWVDVDTQRQILVAYQGTRAVYAALVSTGRAGHATTRGEWRVWSKLATTTMSNADSDQTTTATSVYSVERVPWVMFFHDDQALHGAYWHDRFGQRHSHGCVNLAPRDARWLFAWAPPALPAGWEAVLPDAGEPGLRVRVR